MPRRIKQNAPRQCSEKSEALQHVQDIILHGNADTLDDELGVLREETGYDWVMTCVACWHLAYRACDIKPLKSSDGMQLILEELQNFSEADAFSKVLYKHLKYVAQSRGISLFEESDGTLMLVITLANDHKRGYVVPTVAA